jgi:hypothetical protein
VETSTLSDSKKAKENESRSREFSKLKEFVLEKKYSSRSLSELGDKLINLMKAAVSSKRKNKTSSPDAGNGEFKNLRTLSIELVGLIGPTAA